MFVTLTVYRGKFEIFIIDFAVLMIMGYRSLCSKRRNHAVHAVYVPYVGPRKHISFVILLTKPLVLAWLRVLRLSFFFPLNFIFFLPASSTL